MVLAHELRPVVDSTKVLIRGVFESSKRVIIHMLDLLTTNGVPLTRKSVNDQVHMVSAETEKSFRTDEL